MALGAEESFVPRGEENPSAGGHYLVFSRCCCAEEEVVGRELRHRGSSISSVTGASRDALGAPRLLSVTLARKVPRIVGGGGRVDSRPRLMLLPGDGPSDFELMQCFRAGDWGGLEALYDRYFALAYSICRRRLARPEDAVECANDTFLAMLAYSASLNPYQLDQWLRGMACYLAGRRAHLALSHKNESGLRVLSCYPSCDRGAGERP